MTYHPGYLATGSLATSIGSSACYTSTAKETVVEAIRFYNDSGATRIVTVVVTKSGDSARKYCRIELLADEAASVGHFPMGVGDTLGAYADGANVNYFVLGANRAET